MSPNRQTGVEGTIQALSLRVASNTPSYLFVCIVNTFKLACMIRLCALQLPTRLADSCRNLRNGFPIRRSV
eukprot:12402848-Karenia_brevis.AAC.1